MSMLDPAIETFFCERKEGWLKKNIKAAMDEQQIKEIEQECLTTFSLEIWLPNAAKRAGQISIATHPCTFSHPSARKNKNGYVSSVIATKEKANDGFLKTSNVIVETDALGNAAALDVYKFLMLKMQDNQILLDHIQQETDLAKALLTLKSATYSELRTGFLAMVESGDENVTSSKIKQVYFPVEEDYHQLSLLTNSGMVYQLRKRIDKLRFSEEVKELRDKKRKNEWSDQGYSEIYGLTTIGYGGTKPQNISVLNNQNGGKAHLLSSLPPSLNKRNIHFPKTNFFVESMQNKEISYWLLVLQKIIEAHQNNIEVRNARDQCLQEIMDQIIEKMWAVRSVASEQYYQENSTLPSYQFIWLHGDGEQQRETEEIWLDKISIDISRWIANSYEKIIGAKAIKLGEEEFKHINKMVTNNREALR